MGTRPTKKLTKSDVERFSCAPTGTREYWWDGSCRGLGVVAYPPSARSPQGKKVFVFNYRTKLGGRDGRITLGEATNDFTLDHARIKANRLRTAVDEGKDPVIEKRSLSGALSVKQLAADYLAAHEGKAWKDRTREEYERLIDNQIEALGSRPLVSLTKRDVAEWHKKLSKGTPGAANRALTLLSAIWNWAIDEEIIGAANKAAMVKPNPEEARERYLSQAELGRLGDVLKRAETVGLPWEVDETKARSKHTPKKNRLTVLDPHAVAAIRLLLLTGARLREILHAKWDYIDWDRSMMHLPDSKTGKKTIYLPAPALQVLQALPRIGKSPYIIPGSTPRKKSNKAAETHRADLKKPWAAVTRAAGLKGVRVHDLRHSFAATGAGASLGLPMIGKLLGHSQPATTARYAHLDADPMQRAANLIGNQIQAAMDKRPSADVLTLGAKRA